MYSDVVLAIAPSDLDGTVFYHNALGANILGEEVRAEPYPRRYDQLAYSSKTCHA